MFKNDHSHAKGISLTLNEFTKIKKKLVNLKTFTNIPMILKILTKNPYFSNFFLIISIEIFTIFSTSYLIDFIYKI